MKQWIFTIFYSVNSINMSIKAHACFEEWVNTGEFSKRALSERI